MPDRIDRAEKIIEASPERIFSALTDRDAVEQWLPPDGARGEVHELEPYPGGRFRMTLHFGDGAPGKTTEDSDTVDARFARLVENKLVEQAVNFVSDDPAFSGTMRMVWTITPEGQSRSLVTVAASDVPEGIDAGDHAKGLESSLEHLAEYCGGHDAKKG